MSDNTSNNMGNCHNGTVPTAPIAQNNHEQKADDTHQSSIPSNTVFNFNTPINRNIQEQVTQQQGQDIDMASPPTYLNDPFNPIHYRHLARDLTLEDLFGDYPVDLTTPLDISFFSNPAVREAFKPINEIANLQQVIDAAAARQNAKYCITHLTNRPGLEMELEIVRRKAIGYGTCSTDFAWMPKETGKRCDRCAERERIRRENRASATAAEQAAQQSSGDDSVMSGQENSGL
ncbi:hypothetical protein B0H65DRAFT_512805 [Neurospora tetraspora]|uniref:Uncharacterized protein n=1 Tax=Neurospora tetraspora TaxID=94610 RepID=A0AAE0J0E5_9PEZI|nr:hypothetical protein B0H65DRAFT_512805 [Neurospora tetraspora]